MTTTIENLYGSSNQAITCTITSLGTGGARSSAAIDNSSNLYLDVLVQAKIKSGSGSTSATGYVNFYAYGTADGGTTYPEGAGTDTGVTLTTPPNVRLIGRIAMVANSTTYASEPMSVAAAFGGILPQKWGIIVENQSGGTFDASTASAWYQGVQAQTV